MKEGKKVLLVDADPQGDLTTCLGWRDTDSLPVALPDKMLEVMQDKCKEPTNLNASDTAITSDIF